jgi:tetratricopeptide (TPR) repeat protein
LNAARGAFLKLDNALSMDMTADVTAVLAPPPAKPGGESAKAGASPLADAGPVKVVAPPRRFPLWMLITAGAVILLVAASLIVYRTVGNRTTALDEGVEAYRKGQREAAVNAFTRAAREDKTAVLPHVYLARMAREVGNFTLANQELQAALELNPSDATALREMGANLLAQGNYELSRRFYVRAVQADPTDKMAMGYLGCVLMRLNRVNEGTNWVNRAGPGPWSNCTPAATTVPGTQGTQGPKPVPR